MSVVADDKVITPSLPKAYFEPQAPVNVLDDAGPTPVDTPGLTRGGSPRSSDDGGNSGLNSVPGIAVVGMACRVAGSNDTPEKLWDFLMQGKHGSGEIDPLRWEPYRARDARNAKELDKTTSRGYFVDGIEDFDNMFFGISPKEAELMDPQQRIALEVCWEALESAGIAPQALAGSNTAVYMGVNSDDYGKLLLEDLPGIEAWMGIGTAYCGVPNRISYHLDLLGPSTAVDAACASSLVAIHHGRQSLLANETNLAIVGGVNALYGPGLTKVLDKAGATSPEGICRSFDDESSGYGRGEGAGIVILKRLDDAINDQDNIICVLKGSAVGQDGRTNGIMAPNGKAQELVARNALSAAFVDPLSIGYVEAHATSTPVGDPVEVNAMANVYGKGRQGDAPCLIGSVKPNIGHLEAGAGVMGFIKAAMAVNRGIVPPQANLGKLNSRVNWEEAGVQVVREPTAWKNTNGIRRAGVSSYGYGGTVSHAVLEQHNNIGETFPRLGAAIEVPGEDELAILTFSSPQEKCLATQAETLSSWLLGDGAKESLPSIAITLATRRGHHTYRAAVVAASHDEAARAMKALTEGNDDSEVLSSRIVPGSNDPGTVWVFSGHGAQWKEMGQSLLNNPIFYDAILPTAAIVQTEAGFSPLQALKEGEIESSDKVQILTYVMQIGLAAILTSHGVFPQAIIGHSVGEIAASVVSGALTVQEGAFVVSRRAALYRRVMGQGAMILVSRPFSEIQKELDGQDDIVAAIDSSPSSCVVSGAADVVHNLAESLKARSIKVAKVKTDIAFHSPALAELVEPLREGLVQHLKPKKPSVKLYSTSLLDSRGQNLRDAKYWTDNMVNPVLLRQAASAAAEDGFKVYLEVSTHPIVAHSIEETLLDAGVEELAVIPTISRGKQADRSILTAIAHLHCVGVPISWKSQGTMSGEWARTVPTTTWNHQRYVKKVESGPQNGNTQHESDSHTLLGQQIQLQGQDSTVYVTKLSEGMRPFPGRHPLHGTEIIPAAVLINTFYGTGKKDLYDIVLRVPVALSVPRNVQVTTHQGQITLASQLVTSKEESSQDQSWLTHTTGCYDDKNVPSADDVLESSIDIAAVRKRIGSQLKPTFSTDYLAEVGVSAMGFPWAVTEHFGTEIEMIARVDVSPETPASSPLPWEASSWAPILDSATSIGSTIFFKTPRLRMPAQIGAVKILSNVNPPKIGYIHVQKLDSAALAVNIDVLDEIGTVLVQIENMRFAEIEGTPGESGSMKGLVHQVVWPPMPLTEEPLTLGHVIVVSRDEQAVQRSRKALEARAKEFTTATSIEQFKGNLPTSSPSEKEGSTAVLLYLPDEVSSLEQVSEWSKRFCKELLDIVKYAAEYSTPVKVFVITVNVMKGETPTALAQAPLHGLGRIIASEQAEIWGAVIDTEDTEWTFSLQAIRYAKGGDVVRISDGVVRHSVLRQLPHPKMSSADRQKQTLPRPEGTYLITGGLGALGLEVASFLVEKNARRLVLLSRRKFPPRSTWHDAQGEVGQICRTIERLESLGATVFIVSVDIASESSTKQLRHALASLSLPPILGVVHAAGVLEDELILDSTSESFDRVLAPKVTGSMTLHEVFPVGTLDFMVFFSSCGQLFGFPGQGSYASGNAFLDTLASHRREQGDNCRAFQWTSWRGMGMAASTDFINAELESKGITDISRDEAFRAWEHLARYDTDHGVVLRSRALEADEPLPAPVLADIAVRRRAEGNGGGPNEQGQATKERPKAGPELLEYLDVAIRTCVAQSLQLNSSDDVDPRAALSDLGVDSVMGVALRTQLQKKLGVKMPPTLIWSLPTASHLQKWFAEQLEEK